LEISNLSQGLEAVKERLKIKNVSEPIAPVPVRAEVDEIAVVSSPSDYPARSVEAAPTVTSSHPSRRAFRRSVSPSMLDGVVFVSTPGTKRLPHPILFVGLSLTHLLDAFNHAMLNKCVLVLCLQLQIP